MKYTNARCAVKYASLVVMGFVFCVLFSGTASAQCYFVYSANYAVYTSDGADANNIFTSVLIDGSASMTIAGQYCGPGYQIMQNQINSATHTPSAYNAVGGTGGWGTGSSGCVNCYLSYQNNLRIAGNSGQIYTYYSQGEIYCSVGGIIFGSILLAEYLERAGTYDQATGAGTPDGTFAGEPVYIYPVVHYCTNGTPDYNPSTLDVNEANAATDRYFFATAVLFRFSQTSTWSVLWPTGGATTYGGSQKASPPTPCTHTGPQT